jgi:transcriptional regulator with XRE-family HTH domain
MSKREIVLPLRTKRALVALGNQIQVARLSRNFTMALIAERAGISVPTLRSLEKGLPTASVGSLAMVLLALGLQEDLKKIAAADETGKILAESEMRKRARRSNVSKKTYK